LKEAERESAQQHQCLAALSWQYNPRFSSKWWAEMARQLFRGVRPSGHHQSSQARHLWHYFFHFWPLIQILGCGPTVRSRC